MEASQIKQFIESAGYETFSYSGRGMYGTKCLAFRVENDNTTKELFTIIQHIIDNVNFDNDEDRLDCIYTLCIKFKNAKTDSLGRDMVVYFPYIEWVSA